MPSPLLVLAAEAGGEAVFNSFLAQTAALLVAAAAIGYLCSRLHVVPIVGFLLAGVLIGPNALGLVRDQAVVELVAEVGIVLLLFTIGIEFSLERLGRIRRYVLIGGGAKVLLAIGLSLLVLLPLGVDLRSALFTGFLVSVSSTAIVLKVLADRGEVSSKHGQLALALLIFEDLAAVLMVLLIPVLAGEGGGGEIGRVLLTAAGIITLVLVFARRVMPRLLEIVARTCSPEVFLLSVVAICFGTAWVTQLAGVSVSLGAFLAGLIVSESRQAEHAFGEILPLQILFSASFFLSIGMLLDIGFLAERPLLVLAAIAFGLVIPLLTTGGAALLLRVGAGTTVLTAFLMAQVSEFAFVIQRAGDEAGLTPAGLGESGVQAFIAATVLLMLLTPGMAAVGRRLAGGLQRRGVRRFEQRAAAAPGAEDEQRGHVLISGWGDGAEHLAADLDAAGVPVVVVTLNPDGAAEAEEKGYRVVPGDSTKQHVLLEAGISAARMVVVADDEPEQAARIATVAAELAGPVPLFVRTREDAEVGRLAAAGATHVVSGDRTSRVKLSAAVMEELYGRRAGRTVVDMTRMTRFEPDHEAACPHVSTIDTVLPSSYGCEDCLRLGDEWVHLRVCASCGYVGCCDSSPNRHARQHASAEQHPIIVSAEPDEDWAYCFLDEQTLPPASRRERERV
jgi:CPA2 family monovalent cation:H+ antiporter-2